MNLNNWMASIKQSTPLFNVSIPGTHESCALHDDIWGMTQCQELSIGELLLHGIRFLDIRPAYEMNGKPFEINHGGNDQMITFAEVQEQVVNFLKDNPSEVVLMNIQQESSYVDNAKFVARFDEIVAPYEDYWFYEPRIPTMEEARGRIVLIRGYNPDDYHPDNPTNGGWFSDKGIDLNALTINGDSENDYFRTQNYSTALEANKEKEIKKRIDEGILDNRIVLNYLSYAHGGTATPRRDANATNPVIYDYITNDRPASLLGTLPMDFATNTPGLIEEIIRHNLKWSEVVAGDFSGSGLKDIAVFMDKGNNTIGLSLFTRTVDGYFELKEVWSSNVGEWAASQMSRVMVGDFTGTGKEQIAVFYNHGKEQTGLWLFSEIGAQSFKSEQKWDSGPNPWNATAISDILTGDFTGSGKTEILTYYYPVFDRARVFLFSADSSKPFEPKNMWNGDIREDGK